MKLGCMVFDGGRLGSDGQHSELARTANPKQRSSPLHAHQKPIGHPGLSALCRETTQ